MNERILERHPGKGVDGVQQPDDLGATGHLHSTQGNGDIELVVQEPEAGQEGGENKEGAVAGHGPHRGTERRRPGTVASSGKRWQEQAGDGESHHEERARGNTDKGKAERQKGNTNQRTNGGANAADNCAE